MTKEPDHCREVVVESRAGEVNAAMCRKKKGWEIIRLRQSAPGPQSG